MLTKEIFLVGSKERYAETSLKPSPHPWSQTNPTLAMLTSMLKYAAETDIWHQHIAHLNTRYLFYVHKHANGFQNFIGWRKFAVPFAFKIPQDAISMSGFTCLFCLGGSDFGYRPFSEGTISRPLPISQLFQTIILDMI